MTNHTEEALERLTEFLYIVPVGLLEFDQTGMIKMANPRITQLFNPFSMTGMVTNILEMLETQLPDLVEKIRSFEDSGTVVDNERHTLSVPNGTDTPDEVVLDITVLRQQTGEYYASINNVTEQCKAARENAINNQRLDAIFNRIEEYGIFTIDQSGKVDRWNKSASNATHIDQDDAIGKHYAEILKLEADKAEALLDTTQRCGWVAFQNPSEEDDSDRGDTLLTVINDDLGNLAGYSVIQRRDPTQPLN